MSLSLSPKRKIAATLRRSTSMSPNKNESRKILCEKKRCTDWRLCVIAAYSSPQSLTVFPEIFRVKSLTGLLLEMRQFTDIFTRSKSCSIRNLPASSLPDLTACLFALCQSKEATKSRAFIHLSGHCGSFTRGHDSKQEHCWLFHNYDTSLKTEGLLINPQTLAASLCRFQIPKYGITLAGCNTLKFGKELKKQIQKLDKMSMDISILCSNGLLEDNDATIFMHYVYTALSSMKLDIRSKSGLERAVLFAKKNVSSKVGSLFEII